MKWPTKTPGITLKLRGMIRKSFCLGSVTYSLKGKHKGAIEIDHFVVPSFYRFLPTSSEMAKPKEILSHLEAIQTATLRALVVTNALVSPRLSFKFQFFVISLKKDFFFVEFSLSGLTIKHKKTRKGHFRSYGEGGMSYGDRRKYFFI